MSPTRESRPSAGAAPHETFRGVTSIVRREAVVSRIIRAETSRYCETCRRSLVDRDAAEQHASRGHVVLTTLTTVTAHAAAWERYSDRIDGQIKAAANPKPTHRANAFAGTCTACRQHVPAGAGRIDQIAGRWVVQHLDCSTQTRASDAAIRRAGGSVYAARTGSHGQCEDCGRTAPLTAGRCWDCNNI